MNRLLMTAALLATVACRGSNDGSESGAIGGGDSGAPRDTTTTGATGTSGTSGTSGATGGATGGTTAGTPAGTTGQGADTMRKPDTTPGSRDTSAMRR